MKQIVYGSSAAPLRIEYPPDWDPTAISGLTVTVMDRSGNELLSAQAATRYTATSVDGAVDRYSDNFTLDSGAGALSIGDPILLVGDAGKETKYIKGWDNSNKIVEIEGYTDLEYADNDSVYGCFATYALDISNTTTYTAGIIITVLWTPAGTGEPFTQQVQVSKTALAIEGLEKLFRGRWERAYNAFTQPDNRFEEMAEMAQEELINDLMAENPGIDIHRLIDQDTAKWAVMAQMAWIWALSGDENKEDEREIIGAELEKQKKNLTARFLWLDNNQDFIEDDDETTSYQWTPTRGW